MENNRGCRSAHMCKRWDVNLSPEDGENVSSEPKQSVMLLWTVGQIGAILWKENKDRFLDTPLENNF
jgi:hypothetical protein